MKKFARASSTPPLCRGARALTRLALLAGLLQLAGCGSSGDASSSSGSSSGSPPGSSSGSPSGKRDPIDPKSKCYFTGDVSVGGVDDVIRASGCGVGTVSEGVTLFGMDELRLYGAAYQGLQIQFYLAEPLAPGQVGALKVEDAKLSMSKGGVSSTWVSTTCTVEITKNEVDVDAGVDGGAVDGGKVTWRFRATGKGSCSGPFSPGDSKATGTGTVGPFELMFSAERN